LVRLSKVTLDKIRLSYVDKFRLEVVKMHPEVLDLPRYNKT